MKVTILGCGSASGLPLIGGNWGACDPADTRNRRLRASILVEEGDTTLLVDTGPDMRAQLLACGLTKLDAVLYTHAHADHCHGIDELRSVHWLMKKPMPVYGAPETLSEIEQRFAYIFRGATGGYHEPVAVAHPIDGPFSAGNIKVTPFGQSHGTSLSLGFRLGDFAYSTDVKALDEQVFKTLAGVKVWVVDALREEPHQTHAHLAQTLEWIARVKPQRAILTHMNQTMDYATLAAKLPPGVEPAYDGMTLSC